MPATGEPGYVLSPSLRGNVTIAPDKMWTDLAAAWPVNAVSRETDLPVMRADELSTYYTPGTVTQIHLDCALCSVSVFCLNPDTSAPAPLHRAADILAGILAHLRRSHPDGVAS